LVLFAVPGPNEVTYVIKGSFNAGTQYHFTMETQQCVCVPTDDGMDVYPSSQWMDLAQVGIAEALGMPENRYVLCSGSECYKNSYVKNTAHTRFKIFHNKDTCFPTLLERQIYGIYEHISIYSA
jgi:hypothetical protein